MFININEIAEDGLSFDTDVEVGWPADGADETVEVIETRLRGTARPEERGIGFRAHLEAKLRLVCCRCLAPFESALASDFRLTIVGEAVEFGTDEMEIRKEDTTQFSADGGIADFGVIAAEQIELELPLKPVCRSDCRGLCPTCGTNRNDVECRCREEAVDPRLAALQEWKNRMGEPRS